AQSVKAQPWHGPDANGNISNANSGNVGIGTTSPNTVDGLDLSGYKILHVFSSGTTGARLVVTGGSSSSFDMIHSGASANQKWLNFASNSGKGYIRAVDDSGGGTYNFFVTDMSNGNVGIGTTSPKASLEVNGRVWVTNDNNTSTTSGVGTALSYYTGLGRGGIATYDYANSVYKDLQIKAATTLFH